MRASERAAARRQLDRKLLPLQNNAAWVRPPRGWVKAIREALGLTTRQFAGRLGLSQSRAVEIEQAEASDSITLGSLRRAAEALDCRLVYVLLPNQPLKDIVAERARQKARQRLKSTAHTMALENQSLAAADAEALLKELAQKLLEKSGSSLWDED